jgi:hypothetical protein
MQGARRSAKPGAKVGRRSEPKLGPRRGSAHARPRRPRKRRKPSRLKLALANHPLLYNGIRLSLLS